MQPNNYDVVLQAKAKLGKYLTEKCYSEHYQQLFFNHFVKSFFIPTLLSKVWYFQSTISRRTLKPMFILSYSLRSVSKPFYSLCMYNFVSDDLVNNFTIQCNYWVKHYTKRVILFPCTQGMVLTLLNMSDHSCLISLLDVLQWEASHYCSFLADLVVSCVSLRQALLAD